VKKSTSNQCEENNVALQLCGCLHSLAVVASQICEIRKIWTYRLAIQGHWSWCQWKCICNILLVINSNNFRLAVVGSWICKISRNSKKIRTFSRSSSSILVSIERLAFKARKWLVFWHLSYSDTLLGESVRILISVKLKYYKPSKFLHGHQQKFLQGATRESGPPVGSRGGVPVAALVGVWSWRSV